jgi:hypothetical protein
VTGSTVLIAECPLVWAVGSVAAGAASSQAKERVVQVAGRRHEPPDRGVCDEVGAVARAALHALMATDEIEAGPRVVEAARVEADGIEVTTEMVAVTRAAVARESGVKAAVGGDARSERRVAVQALGRIDTPLSDPVASRAVADSFQARV